MYVRKNGPVQRYSLREVKMDGLAADSKSEDLSDSRQNGSNDPLLL